MQHLHTSRVLPQEIDGLGHMNVRYYLARMETANRTLIDGLHLDAEALGTDFLRRVDTYTRFKREQFEGATLHTLGAVIRHLERLGNDLNDFVKSTIQNNKQRLAMLEGTLQAAHPQRVLERGYLMTTNEKGEVIATVKNLTAGETVSLHFADGTADANIDNIQQREGE